MKTICFLQYFGIGDIIFSQSIAQSFLNNGNKVLWPCKPEWVEGLTRAYPDIDFRDYKTVDVDYNNKNFIVDRDRHIVPLRFADSLMRVPYSDCMKAKYMLMNMDWNDWKKGAQFCRYSEKEKELYYDILNLRDGEDFLFLNRTFNHKATGKVLGGFSSHKKTVEMRIIEGFSLFDWAYVMERASEIHTVSTSIIYILELLDIKCKIHIYIRRPNEDSHKNYDYILRSHDYVLMP